MILTCPACAARFLVDPRSIGAGGRSVRCGRCRHMWFVPEPEEVAAAPAAPSPPQTEPPPPPPPPPPQEGPEPPAFEEAVEAEAPGPAAEPELTPPPLLARDEDAPGPRAARAAHGKGASLPAVRRRPRRWPARLAWVALVVLLVVIGVFATLYRERIVAAWPAAERLYAAIGFEPAPLGAGLKIEMLEPTQVEEDGTMVLSISGRIENTTATTRAVPGLRAALFDAEERELRHWAFRAPVAKLLPKEQVTFETRLENPPKDAVRLSIVFHGED